MEHTNKEEKQAQAFIDIINSTLMEIQKTVSELNGFRDRFMGESPQLNTGEVAKCSKQYGSSTFMGQLELLSEDVDIVHEELKIVVDELSSKL